MSASNGSYHPPATTRCRGQKPASKNRPTRTAATPRSTSTPSSPVDADPANPEYRSFTTELGADDDYWYRVVFADADGDISIATVPIQNSASAIPITVEPYATAAELATILQVNATSNATALERVLIAAAGEINTETGRTDLSGWELELAAQVNLARAEELWKQMKAPWGLIGLESRAGRDPDRP